MSTERVQTTVAFHGSQRADPFNLGGRDTVIYDDIMTNIGDAYDPSNGHFQAPVSGTYAFLVNCMAGSCLYEELEVVLDNDRVGACLSHRANRRVEDLGSTQLMMHLDKGQQVWTRNAQRNSIEMRGGAWSSLTAFLVDADS